MSIRDIVYSQTFVESTYSSLLFIKPLSYLFILVYSVHIMILVSSISFLFKNNSGANSVLTVIKALSLNKPLFNINLINLASLIGLPPLGGFVVKFLLLNNILCTGSYMDYFFIFVLLMLSMAVYVQIIKNFKNTIVVSELDLNSIKKTNANKYNFYVMQLFSILFVVTFYIFYKMQYCIF